MPNQSPDTQPGHYYISMIDGDRYSLLLGPYTNNHQAALDMVDKVRRKAIELDPRAHFYGFGTCRVELDVETREGVLNSYFEM